MAQIKRVMPTVADWIERLQRLDPSMPVFIDMWTTNDVHDRAEQMQRPPLSNEEALEVLSLMEEDHDLNTGMSWEVVDTHLSEVVGDNEFTHEYDDQD